MHTLEDRGRQAVAAFRGGCAWLEEDAYIPYELAKGAVTQSAWWLDHPQVGAVRSPGDARHIEVGSFGYRVYGHNGGNSFEITLFIAMARVFLAKVVNQLAIVDKPYDPTDVREVLAAHANQSVSDFQDSVYAYYGEPGWLPFGNHGINTVEAAEYIIQQSGFYDVTQWSNS